VTAVREVIDGVKALADLIVGTRTMLEALHDGQAYLARNYPDAKSDLAELLKQMRITVAGVNRATSVVTDFWFTIDGSTRDGEPARFNESLIRAREQVAKLEADISALKGSCWKVNELSQALDRRANHQPWWAMLGDKAAQRAWELADKLHTLYGADEGIIQRIEQILVAQDRALDAVKRALQAGHGSSVENVAKAAAVLDEQANALKPARDQLKQLRDDLDDQIRTLI
jgi:hypothetical protein